MPSCWCFGHLCWLNLGWGYNTAPLSLIWLTFTGLTLKYPFYRCKVENGMEPRKTRSKSSWDGLVFFWFLEIHFFFSFLYSTLLDWSGSIDHTRGPFTALIFQMHSRDYSKRAMRMQKQNRMTWSSYFHISPTLQWSLGGRKPLLFPCG